MPNNAARFIAAYNKIDKALRNLNNFKANMTFTDVVRKSAAGSFAVRKYEDELLDYSRLRNAIVHNANDKIVIAEPHADITEHIERIAGLLCAPPPAVKYARRAVTVSADKPLADVIKLMAASGYSNVPVLNDHGVIGVINNKLIVETLARLLGGRPDGALEQSLYSLNAASALTAYSEHYILADRRLTVDKALCAFADRPKLQIIVITASGSPDSGVEGILTTGDIMALNRIMENY
ncbi:MAG: CBS domain-containing protein [Clostridiales bacterium]|jgi:CBS domain-containing protein|nr:CBS domain-containing protein [Clostridiales bacterium]